MAACDGDHPTPVCDDKECWLRPSPNIHHAIREVRNSSGALVMLVHCGRYLDTWHASSEFYTSDWDDVGCQECIAQRTVPSTS